MPLSRDAILALPIVLPREEVFIPEWGDSVHVRCLTAWERDELEIEWDRAKRHNFRARLAVACVCDAEGNDLFEVGDIERLGRQPASILARLADVAFRLNKFTKEDQEALEKNSVPTNGDASLSG